MANSFDARSIVIGDDIRAGEHLSNLLGRIPGYSGYRDKEDRRDADRAVREDLGRGLTAAADRVERVARDLADRRKLGQVSSVDSWVQAIRHLGDRIRTASYGYGGIFGDALIDAEALDQLRTFDESLLAQLQSLEDPIEALEAALVADGNLQSAVDRGLTVTRELSSRFDARDAVIKSGEVAPETRMQDVLDQPEAPSLPELWSLDAGDAVSVQGEDFLVDARLDVAAAGDAFRLFRLGERGAGRWLYVPKDAAKRPGLVSLAAADSGSGGSLSQDRSAMVEMIGPTGDPRSATAAYEVRSSENDSGQLTIVVAWPSEQMTWTGEQLMPEEITNYGSPGASG